MFTRTKLIFIFASIFLVSCFLFFILTSSLSRQLSRNTDSGNNTEIVVFLNDFANAKEQARIERKPLIVFFTLADNESCKRSFELFRYQEIRRLAKHFICVSVDGTSMGPICELYRIKSFPTILILESEGKEIQRLTGKKTQEQLSVQMHIAIQLATNANKLR